MTPDPRFLYLSAHHREALAHLRYGVQERLGFVAIIGEVGTGKTTLIHALLSSLDARAKTAFIFSTSLTAKGLLRMMASDFGIAAHAKTKTKLLLDLHKFLLEQFASGINCVLIVDEAQNLSLNLLEEIRMLSNLETDREKLLQIVLVGQPELATKLALPKLRQLRQRINTRYHIHPLDRQETEKYIGHRLKVAGLSTDSIFGRRAVERIYQWSGGIPRLINLICDNALLLGYTREKKKIDLAIIDETIADLKATGILSDGSPTVEPTDNDVAGKNIGSGLFRWQRAFRTLAAASGLLLAAALLSLPLASKGPHVESSPNPLTSKSINWIPATALEQNDDGIPQEGRIMLEPHHRVSEDVVAQPAVGFFSVHVASFRQQTRAIRLAETLRQEDLGPVFIIPVQLPELGSWYRVMLGRYEDGKAAELAAQRHLDSGDFQYSRPRFVGQTDEIFQPLVAR